MREGYSHDVAIVGAGPAGCMTALAFAKKGARVLLLEADPRAVEHAAVEWLHPPALAILDRLGIDLTPATPYPTGKGFVVHPCDGSEAVVLPYHHGRFGFALDHALLVETMRAHCEREPRIELSTGSRATRIEGQSLTFERRHGSPQSVTAPLIVGASGRTARGAHGLPERAATSSRIAGLTLDDTSLPFEGYFHVFLGAPGPVTAYRVDARRVRLSCDVPLSLPLPREGGIALYEAYASVLPRDLRESFRAALSGSQLPHWSSIDLRPRVDLGREGFALVGDAVGTHHPLVAGGLTLAIEDAAALADAESFGAYRRARMRDARVPEMLAVALYELFADDAEGSVAMRRAIYALWHEKPGERLRTMGFLSGEDRSHPRFARSFFAAMVRGLRGLAYDAARTRRVVHVGRVASDLGERTAWLALGTLHRAPKSAEDLYGAALHASRARAEIVGLPRARGTEEASMVDPLRRGVRALVAEQAADGSFEGEVVWCAMLAAQYVLACHAMGRTISPERRARLLMHFERTRHSSGAWGLHELSEPYLFVTVLVYVACRLLGLAKDDPLIARAHAFMRREGGAAAVPTWGKFWLAIVGLYEWSGVSPVLPEVFRAPRWLPIHPSRYYCHTRLIYLAMAVIHGEKWQAPVTPRILALRDELFLGGFEAVDFSRARESLRTAEIHSPWSVPLRIGYRIFSAFDHARRREDRAQLLTELRDRIRYELRSTHYTAISPVSGLLDQIALHIADPNDPDLAIARDRFEGWIWEDEVLGMRVAGARSATWDTSLASRALSACAPHLGTEARDALARADTFLSTQQIRRGTGMEGAHDRVDPSGGYCFAGVWHGWPVSDCTAEAMLARIESGDAGVAEMELAARFVLRCQNSDGGFGSYEPRRVDVPLEWLNPAEMFGDSMTEKSYVECTASCVCALAAFHGRWPESPVGPSARKAIAGGVALLRRTQQPDGAWPGMWGVHFVYGTMFGVRGLLAGGVPSHDPQIRRACAFLRARQRDDGAWGEHPRSVLAGRYVDRDGGQVVQTAWAMTTLLEARDPDFAAIERAAHWLAATQNLDGTWPKQDPEGIFFHTALLDYSLYRRYFPVLALGLYETRRRERARFRAEKPTRAAPSRSIP